MRPHLARPWIHAFSPFELHAPWWTPPQRDMADSLFRAPIGAHPVIVFPTIHRLPDLGIPQVCVVGRSNVGKSSLINALVHGKEIARSSEVPGRTRHLFVFDIGDEISLVDLPGAFCTGAAAGAAAEGAAAAAPCAASAEPSDEDVGGLNSAGAVLADTCRAMQDWLGENKRMEDFRHVAREMEVLQGRLSRATRRFSKQPGNSVTAKDDALLEDEEAAEAPPSTEVTESTTELTLHFQQLRFRFVLRCQTRHGEVDFHSVALLLMVEFPGQVPATLAEFSGHRSSDFAKDQAMNWLDHPRVRQLQKMMLPSLPSPVLLLD
ncbi:unnamed protein product, partial [Effrenium voratum]